ncbi:hypothetical protein N5079_20520 [Planotetraspora sp. A-T 1434]|uniref:hypothetical protein n=1 Tax=Planotetraspora sp. A-T 1434 TaxID=2979219 RepID=UPI0021C0649C|nr:hypothetical protein [Planotetraspora sp. A-T 1434]MCT9932589.1 hypothetical protein [Planotetraspora sp. A-T 1434]
MRKGSLGGVRKGSREGSRGGYGERRALLEGMVDSGSSLGVPDGVRGGPEATSLSGRFTSRRGLPSADSAGFGGAAAEGPPGSCARLWRGSGEPYGAE